MIGSVFIRVVVFIASRSDNTISLWLKPAYDAKTGPNSPV